MHRLGRKKGMSKKGKIDTMNPRLKGMSIDVPIVYGNISYFLGKKAEEGKTHRWTCYIRGLQGENLTYFIKKVVFTLHPSFPNSKRVIEKPPFEVTEVGWGEFEVGIKVHFVDSTEHPVDLFHPLKLYPPEGQIQNQKKPIVSEHYDEIIFNQPREELYNIILENKTVSSKNKIKLSEFYTNFSEEEELQRLQEAQKKVKTEIQALKEKYEQLEADIGVYQTEITQLTTESIT